MSLLTGTLPTAVEICGRQVKIRADFRAGLAFERALGDESAGSAATAGAGAVCAV